MLGIGKRISRLFMDPVQQQLTNPDDYRKTFSGELIAKEIEAGALGRMCNETRSGVQSAIKDRMDESGYITIEDVADSQQRMSDILLGRRTISENGYPITIDADLHDCLAIGNAGHSALLGYLIQRANGIADGIKPGATQTMSDAFFAQD